MATTKTKTNRIKFAEGCTQLGVSDRKLRRMIAVDVFTVIRDGCARTSPKYLLADELDLYIEEQAIGNDAVVAVKNYRRKKGRLKVK